MMVKPKGISFSRDLGLQVPCQISGVWSILGEFEVNFTSNSVKSCEQDPPGMGRFNLVFRQCVGGVLGHDLHGRKSDIIWADSVDGSEIRPENQLRLVAEIPLFTKFFYTSPVVSFGGAMDGALVTSYPPKSLAVGLTGN